LATALSGATAWAESEVQATLDSFSGRYRYDERFFGYNRGQESSVEIRSILHLRRTNPLNVLEKRLVSYADASAHMAKVAT
jgi:hypothetical protein